MGIVKIIGGLLVALGIVDLAGSFFDFDLWQTVGINLEGVFYQYSAMALIIVGGLLWSAGSKGDDEEAENPSE